MSQQDFLSGPSPPASGLKEENLSADANRASLSLDDFEKVDADQFNSTVPASNFVGIDDVKQADAAKSAASADELGEFLDVHPEANRAGIPEGITQHNIVGITGAIDDSNNSSYPIHEFDPIKSDFSVPTGHISDDFNAKEAGLINKDMMGDIATVPEVSTYEAHATTDFFSSAPPAENLLEFSIDKNDPKIISSHPSGDYFSTTNASIGVTTTAEDILDPIVDQFEAKGKPPNNMNPVSDFDDLINPSSQFSGSQMPDEPSSAYSFIEEETITPLKATSHRDSFPILREPSPPTEPAPTPMEPTPPLKQPTVPVREPTPPPRESTPPPREPTPPPREPTPPPREPTPPPRVPTPPPKKPALPSREPTPPPREPTPPPQKPTPPTREPTPPPKKPTPPLREPTPPPRGPTPPPQQVIIQRNADILSGSQSMKEYPMDASTKAALAVFNPSKEHFLLLTFYY